MKIEPQLSSHCGYSNHPGLQSLNNYNFFFFLLQLYFVKFSGHVIYRWNFIFKTFPMMYYKPPNSKHINW